MRSKYASRIGRLTRAICQLDRALTLLSRGKRWATYSVIGYAVFDPTAGILLVPLLIGLIPVTIVQSRCLRRWRRAGDRAAYYTAGMRRLDGQWQGRGEAGLAYSDPAHPYAGDLDLFGPGSLFEFLCTAHTRVGRDTLAGWLLSPADRQTILERQEAVQELRDRIDLREAAATARCDNRRVALDVENPISTGRSVMPARRGRCAAHVLSAVLLTALVGAVWAGGRWWMLLAAAVAAEAALFHVVRARLVALCRSFNHLNRCDQAAAAMVRIMRRANLTRPLLRRQCHDVAGKPWFSQIIRRTLSPLVRNEPAMLLLVLQVLPSLEDRHRQAVARSRIRISAIGEFEALCALATYAFEHPEDVLPEIVEPGPHLDCAGLGHPLLPEGQCVRNDVRFEPPQRLLLISGSNMSGKTTLLRSVGINVVLALAGAPVHARQMGVSPFAVGSAMRFADSLRDGTSHFATVVQRMKRVIDMQNGPRPLLYLFDEILQGTNSLDRRVGAEAVLRKLVDAGAFGLVSTHDLALTEIVDVLKGRAANMHFEDRVVDGQLTFDYRLRADVARTSNALDVMRSFGLDV